MHMRNKLGHTNYKVCLYVTLCGTHQACNLNTKLNVINDTLPR